MTDRQRMSILADWWPRACKAQGWKVSDRDLRLDVISQAVGRPISTMHQLDNSRDVDRVKAHLLSLADDLAATVETTREDDPGLRRRLLFLIRKQSAQLGGEPYVMAIARDRFHLVAGVRTLDDLSTEDLRQLMMTLKARRQRRVRAADARSSLQVTAAVSDDSDPF